MNDASLTINLVPLVGECYFLGVEKEDEEKGMGPIHQLNKRGIACEDPSNCIH